MYAFDICLLFIANTFDSTFAELFLLKSFLYTKRAQALRVVVGAAVLLFIADMFRLDLIRLFISVIFFSRFYIFAYDTFELQRTSRFRIVFITDLVYVGLSSELFGTTFIFLFVHMLGVLGEFPLRCEKSISIIVGVGVTIASLRHI
jgi:hypothetical protein